MSSIKRLDNEESAEIEDVSKKYKQELQWLKQHSTKGKQASRRKTTPDAEKEINKSTNITIYSAETWSLKKLS